MNRWERRFANFCAMTGLLLLLLAGALYLVEQRVSSGASYSLLAGIALLIAYGILDPSAITDFIRSRQARFGSVSAVVTALVIGILVSVNVYASRGTQTIDLTHGGLNTLAPQSVLAVQRLTSDLQVVGLFRIGPNNGQREAEALLSLYEAQSPRVKYRSENFDTDLLDVRQYGARIPNTLVFDYKNKTELLTPGSQAEQDVTSSILKLESDHVPLVCWAVGDGERDLKETNPSFGYSSLADVLARNNFATRDLLLSQAVTVPAACDLLAVVGPTHQLLNVSVKALTEYISSSGNLLLVADPWQDPKVAESMNAVLKPLGPGFSGGLVIEPDTSRAASGDPTTPVVVSFGISPITRNMQGTFTFFPQTTVISGTAGATVTAVPIGVTSVASYEVAAPRRDLTRVQGDRAGPFSIMETLEKPVGPRTARVALVGTAAFAENLTLPPNSTDANLQLALATFQWLSGQDSLISIPPKASRNLPLALTQQDQSLLILSTGFGLPALMLFGGLAVWWRRRY